MPETAATAPPIRHMIPLPMKRSARVLAVIDRWHDEHHGVGWRRHCHEQPCRDVTDAAQ